MLAKRVRSGWQVSCGTGDTWINYERGESVGEKSIKPEKLVDTYYTLV